MKRILGKLIKGIIVLFSHVFSPKLSRKIDLLFNQVYTIWLAGEFNYLGYGSGISKPISLHGGKYIKIGENFSCDQRLRLDAIDEFLGDKFTPEIIIGNNVLIQKDCHIGAINKVYIGNNVLLASKVYISDHSHGKVDAESIKIVPAKRRLFSKGAVIIEDNVWIGEGAVILPNVIIGENSIIGANAVVSKSIPKNSVAAGNPARVIKELN